MHINANAFIARRAKSKATGRVVTVHSGANTNDGSDIVWVKVEGQKPRKFTGAANIAAVYREIDDAIAAGEAEAV